VICLGDSAYHRSRCEEGNGDPPAGATAKRWCSAKVRISKFFFGVELRFCLERALK
jgi:hypothetical protein